MREIDTGSAAEAYVYFRLRSWGYDVHFANGLGSPFDLWIPEKQGIVTIQVKGTRQPEARQPGKGGSVYGFGTAQGSRKTPYDDFSFDIMALVAMPDERAFFITKTPGKRRRVSVRKFDEVFERRTWEKSLERVLDARR